MRRRLSRFRFVEALAATGRAQITHARSSSFLIFSVLAACSSASEQRDASREYHLQALQSGSTASFRGLAVVDARTAWASGTRGTVLRTTNGGGAWDVRSVPDADSLDFRDIAAFDSSTAYVLSAGEDGRIYKTIDGGRSWTLQFRNRTKDAFFDCFDFWDARHGLAMSDPVDGKPLLIRTDDGKSWQPIARERLPDVLKGEAAFAASGTCLVTTGSRRVLLATGGGARARVFVSNDRGDSWDIVDTPVAANAPSAGIFSLAFRDGNTGIAIGGDYQKPSVNAVAAITSNGGRTWVPAGKTSYVSGAAFLPRSSVIAAAGTSGTRISSDRGVTWVTIDTLEYNTVQFARDGVGFVAGPRGRVAKLLRR